MSRIQKLGFISGIVVTLFVLFFVNLDPQNPQSTKMLAIAILMAIWWVTEAIPLAATSLIPLILFPFLDIMSGEDIASSYINSIIFLFLGGFMLAIAMERWQLHKRIALKIITLFGGTPNSIIYGFMIAAAFLSMWISNTATAVMMLPIGLAIITKMENQFGKQETENFSKTLMLAIAYSCSIGGVATLIGTPPNLAFVKILHIMFPKAPEISFGSWMMLALPIAILLMFIVALFLTKVFFKFNNSLKIEKSFILNEYDALGKITNEEKIVAVIFSLTALMWIFRSNLNLGIVQIPGWSNLFRHPKYFNDGVIAITMASLLFLIPGKEDGKRTTILDNKVFSKIPWGIILLFGGGFALAKGFTVTGLSDLIGNKFHGMANYSPILIVLTVAITINLLTELTSNTATAQMILPIMASVSVAIGYNPLLLMITATLSASMAFMLPVATPPNTIVFASERLKIIDMAKTGIGLNIISVLIISLLVYLLGSILFNLNVFPSWAVLK